jgi:hypothetical protein
MSCYSRSRNMRKSSASRQSTNRGDAQQSRSRAACQTRYKEGEELYLLALAIQERRLGPQTSTFTRGLPTDLDFQRQKRRNALRCHPIKVAGLTIINALRQSNQRASLENTNLSAAVVGIGFFSRSRNRPNCLRKNRFSAARAVWRRQTPARKLKPSLTIVRRFRTKLESRVKTLNILQSSHANSVISRADPIFA